MEFKNFHPQRSGLYSLEVRPTEPEGIFVVRDPATCFRIGNFALIHGLTEQDAVNIVRANKVNKAHRYIRERPNLPGEFLIGNAGGSLRPIEGGRPIRFKEKIWEYQLRES